MNLEALTAELLGQPLDQFTPQRNAKVKALKASGQADLARELSTLKKPSVPLWVANQIDDRALLAGLRSAAQAVVKAQAAAATGRSNAARDLRAASEAYQKQLDAVGNAATAALRRGGHAASEEAVRRIREIFRLASLQGGETWERLQKRALAVEPHSGEDVLEMFAGGGAPVTSKRAEQVEARRAADLAEKAARADAELAQRAIETARRRRQEATDAAAAAERAAERAAAAEDEAVTARAQAEKSRRASQQRKSG